MSIHIPFLSRTLLTHFRGINEGRQCAREVDAFLIGTSSQLPVTGGIVHRPAIDTIPQPAEVVA